LFRLLRRRKAHEAVKQQNIFRTFAKKIMKFNLVHRFYRKMSKLECIINSEYLEIQILWTDTHQKTFSIKRRGKMFFSRKSNVRCQLSVRHRSAEFLLFVNHGYPGRP